jgi:hypothetical protein
LEENVVQPTGVDSHFNIDCDREGWIVIVADGTLVCCPKGWQETVVKWEVARKVGVWSQASQMGEDRMESVSLEKVMVCVGDEDMNLAR